MSVWGKAGVAGGFDEKDIKTDMCLTEFFLINTHPGDGAVV